VYSKLLEGATGLSNVSRADVFEALVEASEQVGVGLPQWMYARVSVLRSIQEVSSLPPCEAGQMASYQDLFTAWRRAKDAKTPAYDSLSSLEAKVQNCAILDLNSTTVTLGSIDNYMNMLERAREVAVPESKLTAVVSAAQAVVKTFLSQALASVPGDATELHEAFLEAERAGLTAAELSSAASSIKNKTLARLQVAEAALVSTNRSTSAIEELAKAIAMGSSVTVAADLMQEELAAARTRYEAEFFKPVQASDLPFLEAAIAFADYANAKVPPNVSQMIGAARRLHQAVEEHPEELAQLLAILDQSDAMHTPSNQDKQTVTAAAKEKARAELEAASTGSNYQAIRTALSAAVQAGVPESSLQAARTILNSV